MYYRHAAAKSLQSCPTLCDPIDGRPSGSPVAGILQARTLEGVAISFPNAWKWKVKVKSLSHVRLLATPWTAAYQAPPSMGLSRQEYWSEVPSPSPIIGIDICIYSYYRYGFYICVYMLNTQVIYMLIIPTQMVQIKYCLLHMYLGELFISLHIDLPQF